MITRLGTKVGDCDEMRLRSGHRVGVDGPAAKIPQTAAEARAMLMKDAVRMPDEHVLAFKQGLAGLLNRWTALQLAITNEWGGAESVQKGEAMREELEDWFLKRRGGKYAEDLEELLAEILGDDFACSAKTGRRAKWRTSRVTCSSRPRRGTTRWDARSAPNRYPGSTSSGPSASKRTGGGRWERVETEMQTEMMDRNRARATRTRRRR